MSNPEVRKRINYFPNSHSYSGYQFMATLSDFSSALDTFKVLIKKVEIWLNKRKTQGDNVNHIVSELTTPESYANINIDDPFQFNIVYLNETNEWALKEPTIQLSHRSKQDVVLRASSVYQR